MFHVLEGNEIQIKIAEIPLIRIRINKSMLPVMCWCYAVKQSGLSCIACETVKGFGKDESFLPSWPVLLVVQ